MGYNVEGPSLHSPAHFIFFVQQSNQSLRNVANDVKRLQLGLPN